MSNYACRTALSLGAGAALCALARRRNTGTGTRAPDGASWGELLVHLIHLSEAASRIARLVRAKIIQYTVQQKFGAESNQRFQRDFKTLADVFIQQLYVRALSASGAESSPYANLRLSALKSATPAMPAYSWFIMASSTT